MQGSAPSDHISLINKLLLGLMSLFVLTLYLSLGSDTPSQYTFRLSFVYLLFSLFAVKNWKTFKSFYTNHVANLIALFLVYLLLRLIVVSFAPAFAVKDGEGAGFSGRYAASLVMWTSIACLSFAFFKAGQSRRSINLFMLVIALSGFFIAVNAIPPLLAHGKVGYSSSGGTAGFFYPLFYLHPEISKWFMGRYAHPNWTGDVMGFGFFCGLGLVLYAVQDMFNKKDVVRRDRTAETMRLLLLVFGCFLTASGIFILFSRGTVLSFGFSLGLYFIAVIVRFRQSSIVWAVILLLGAISAGVLLTGNTQDMLREIQSVKTEQALLEIDPSAEMAYHRGASIFTNREGMSRAFRMYKDHPIWGVGLDGYVELSKSYLSGENWARYTLANYESMCHYLHVMAEEGVGAFLYFLILAVYFFYLITGLLKTKSRYQFIMALSLAAPVVMVLTHALFNHLMQRYAMSLMVYLNMALSLAVLHPDFEHSLKQVRVRKKIYQEKK